MLQSRKLHATKSDATKSDSFTRCFSCYMLQFFFCSMLHATLSNMFVINWCSMLQTTFDLCLNSVLMCMDVRITLEKLCVQLNIAYTNISAGESSCDEKHEKSRCTQIKERLCWCTITAPRPLCEFSCWLFHVSKAWWTISASRWASS